MKLYLSGVAPSLPLDFDSLLGLPGLAFHVSFAAIRAGGPRWEDWLGWCDANTVPLFLDSGAALAMESGVEIRNEDYVAFAWEHREVFETVAALDVDGDPATTWANYQKMLAAGVADAVPVFHFGEPWAELDRLMDATGHFGLMVGKGVGRRAKMAWTTACFRRAFEKNPEARLHGFGATSTETLASFPWYSADSATWCAPARWGQLLMREDAGMVSPHWADLVERPEVAAKSLGRIPAKAGDPRDKAPGLQQGAAVMLRLVDEITRWRAGTV